MTKLKKFSICLVSGMLFLGTVSFARTGIVNAPNGLVLRETAAKGANPITTVSDKEKVEILEENGEWYKVKYGSYQGYMFAEYVDAEKVVEEKPQVEETPAEEIEQPQESASTQESEQPQEEVKVYPQNIKLKTNVKIYIIPSITSKVILNSEADKEITINYELNDWVNVTYNNIQGWVRKYYINVEVPNEQVTENAQENNNEKPDKEENNTTTEEQNNTVAVQNKRAYIDVSVSANIRETASTSASIITTLTRNTGVTIIGEEGDFYKIKYQDITGYVAKSLVSDRPVEVTSRSSEERKVEQPKQEITTNKQENTTVVNSSVGQNVADFAKKYLGYKYVYGGTTPSNRI
ncbi:MAG: SH3 domain-containing protein [Clostridia bacterium]|nr:SH3 domain-containing protein [Clostridia bacterium]